MQIKGLHKNIYNLYQSTRTQEYLEKYKEPHRNKIEKWQKLKSEGVSDKVCSEIVGISRASYFRSKKALDDLNKGIAPPFKRPKRINRPKWGEAEKQLILSVRRANPTYGKAKIAVILKRDHKANISESTVGRILKVLKEKGLLTKSLSAVRVKRKRNFKSGHAKPWTFKKYSEMKMGERVQIDHMIVPINGIYVKHFKAWERKSKYIYANVYSHAKSSSAKKFLLDFVKGAPFKIHSIQVDGGSEFMAEFEEACAELGLELFVLPPRRPDYNGGVERGNRIFREEFYSRNNLLEDSIGGIRAELKKEVFKYNSYRPHFGLNGMTPLEYIKNCS